MELPFNGDVSAEGEESLPSGSAPDGMDLGLTQSQPDPLQTSMSQTTVTRDLKSYRKLDFSPISEDVEVPHPVPHDQGAACGPWIVGAGKGSG